MRRPLALEFIARKHKDWGSDCYALEKPQKRILFQNKTRSIGWVVCFYAYGAPEEGQVPVNDCGAWDCCNGTHWHWGTMQEALDNRVFPSRRGGKNPNAKLDEDDVAILRAVNWERGTFKRAVWEHLGITPQTFHAILRGKTWKGVNPYVSSVPPHPGSVLYLGQSIPLPEKTEAESKDEGDAF